MKTKLFVFALTLAALGASAGSVCAQGRPVRELTDAELGQRLQQLVDAAYQFGLDRAHLDGMRPVNYPGLTPAQYRGLVEQMRVDLRGRRAHLTYKSRQLLGELRHRQGSVSVPGHSVGTFGEVHRGSQPRVRPTLPGTGSPAPALAPSGHSHPRTVVIDDRELHPRVRPTLPGTGSRPVPAVEPSEQSHSRTVVIDD